MRSTKHLRKVFFVLPLFLVAQLLLYGACSGENTNMETSLALDWFANSNHAGIYLAEEKGYFQEDGLDIQISTPSDPTSIIPLVATGAFDFGITYQPDLIQARSEGLPVVSVMAFVQHPLNSVMTLADSSIERISDLVDKKIGYPGIPSQKAVLKATLENSGLSSSEVENVLENNLINVGFDLVRVLLTGEVDAILGAYWTHESIVIEERSSFPKIFKLEENGAPDYYELLLITNEDFLAENEDVVASVVRSLNLGYLDSTTDKEGALSALINGADVGVVDESVEDKGLDLLIPIWGDTQVPFGWQDGTRWEEFSLWMKERGLASQEFDYTSAYTNDFVALLQ